MINLLNWITARKLSYKNIGSVVPYEQLAYNGSSISIKCHSYHIPLWTKKGGLPSNLQFQKEAFVLVVPRVLESNSGTYTCHGTINEKEMNFFKRTKVYVGCKFMIKIYYNKNTHTEV